MGRYDDILASLPKDTTTTSSGGKYDDLLASLPEAKPTISPFTAYDVANELTPANIVRKYTLDPLGEKVAELGGRLNHPILGAGVGTAIQVAPEILSTGLGLKALYDSTDSAVKGALNSTKELGPDYEAQNAKIGVERRVPPEGGMKPQYTPPERIAPTKQSRPVIPAEPTPSNVPVRYPSKPGDFMAYAKGRLGSPKPVAPQELMDWQVKLQTDMSNGTIPKIDPTTGRTTTIFQQATDLLNRTKTAFNGAAERLLKDAELPAGVIPTRQGLNQAFARAAGREATGRTIKKAARVGTGIAAGVGGLKTIWDYATGKRQ